MGTRTHYAPGIFAWVDLRTTDPADAKRFYTALFGWDYTNAAGGYTAATLAGEAVAGLKQLTTGQRAPGAAPFWLTYVAVADADAAASHTRELGGTVRAQPFDSEAGRMTVIGDPTGGMLCLWQSREGIGACRRDEPGCLAWNELSTTDMPAAIRFYAGLFGWRIEPGNGGPDSPYRTIEHHAVTQGGVREARTRTGWMPYFAVPLLDEALDRVSGAGGKLIAGPHHLHAGRAVTVRDPQGAEFGVAETRIAEACG